MACLLHTLVCLLELWRGIRRINLWTRTVSNIEFSIRFLEPEAERRIIAIAEIVKCLVEVLDSKCVK